MTGDTEYCGKNNLGAFALADTEGKRQIMAFTTPGPQI
jgi:hypothetical protein